MEGLGGRQAEDMFRRHVEARTVGIVGATARTYFVYSSLDEACVFAMRLNSDMRCDLVLRRYGVGMKDETQASCG